MHGRLEFATWQGSRYSSAEMTSPRLRPRWSCSDRLKKIATACHFRRPARLRIRSSSQSVKIGCCHFELSLRFLGGARPCAPLAAAYRKRSSQVDHRPCGAERRHHRLRLPAVAAHLLRAEPRRGDPRWAAAKGLRLADVLGNGPPARNALNRPARFMDGNSRRLRDPRPGADRAWTN